MKHVHASFAFLYPRMAPDGVYMVEDLHTAYWDEYEGGLHRPGSFIELCKNLLDELNADWSRGALPPTDFTRCTQSMHFYDSIALFERGRTLQKSAPTIPPSTALHKPILFAELDDSLSSPRLAVRTSGTVLVIYNYFEKNTMYRDNLDYFLKKAIIPTHDYIITLNGGCSLNLPLVRNIRYLYRPNIGFDFGAYDDVVNSMINIDQYDYFFFVNCTVRGPFLPAYYTLSWTVPFIEKLTSECKLAGLTVNVMSSQHEEFRFRQYSNECYEVYNFRRPYSHVQSMVFAMDRTCLNFLKRNRFFNRGYELSIGDVIIKHEILLSQLVIANGWNIASILPESRYSDYRHVESDFNPSSNFGDPWFPGAYFNRSLHPLEVVFFKTNRGIMDEGLLRLLSDSQLSLSSKPGALDDGLLREHKLASIPTAWGGHKNFATWLVSRLKAQTIVDLGVDFGYSTFCFALACSGQVYGIDPSKEMRMLESVILYLRF